MLRVRLLCLIDNSHEFQFKGDAIPPAYLQTCISKAALIMSSAFIPSLQPARGLWSVNHQNSGENWERRNKVFFPCLVNTEKFGRRSPLNKLSSIFWNHWAGWRVRSLDWFDLTNPPFLGHHPVYFFFCFWPNNKNCQWYNKIEGWVWALYLISSQQGFKPTAFYTQVGKNSASKSRPNFGFNILTKLQPKVFTKIQLQNLNHTSSIIGACQHWPIGTRIE